MRHLTLPVGLLVTFAFALTGCGDESQQDLKTLDGDGFLVNMPGSPKRKVESVATGVGRLKTILYTSDGAEEAYSVGYTELPPQADGDLHSAIASGAANVGGTVHDEKATTYTGFKARDARITGADKNRGTIFVRALLTEDRLYLLQFIGKGANLMKAPPRFAEIVNSLKIE